MPEPKPTLVCYFDTPAEIYHACEKLRDAGIKHFDAHTPFPVHGLEKAMGLKPTKLPWIVLASGTTGLVGGTLMQWWMAGVDYPINISGKPAAAFQAFVPLSFEVTILLSAFGCFYGLWALTKLPKFYDPVMKHPSWHRATDDKFFVSIEPAEPKFEEAKKILESLGAQEMVEVEP